MIPANRPNIVYIHSHDTGRYVQPYGYQVPTPNLQRLAELRGQDQLLGLPLSQLLMETLGAHGLGNRSEAEPPVGLDEMAWHRGIDGW